MKQPIYPCLWFNGNAGEAAQFYSTVFNDCTITADTPMVVMFEASGQTFMCLNGGPTFTPNTSISFFVVCETIDEVQASWRKLSEQGKVLMPLDSYPWSEQYGWVQDRFGISWQLSYGQLEDVGQKFTPTLLFAGPQQGKAEGAIHFYTSVFQHSAVVGILRHGADDGEVEGTVKHAQFSLAGSVFMAMDSSIVQDATFNEGISLVIECTSQDEIDYYWNQLTIGGAESNCGWLKDQYGVSWQIVPAVLKELMQDRERAPRVMQAFMKMKKFEIEELVNA